LQVTAKAVSSSRSSSSEKRRSGGDRRSGDFSNWDIDTVSWEKEHESSRKNK